MLIQNMDSFLRQFSVILLRNSALKKPSKFKVWENVIGPRNQSVRLLNFCLCLYIEIMLCNGHRDWLINLSQLINQNRTVLSNTSTKYIFSNLYVISKFMTPGVLLIQFNFLCLCLISKLSLFPIYLMQCVPYIFKRCFTVQCMCIVLIFFGHHPHPSFSVGKCRNSINTTSFPEMWILVWSAPHLVAGYEISILDPDVANKTRSRYLKLS